MKKQLIVILFFAFSVSCYAAVNIRDIPHKKTIVIPVQFLDVKFTKNAIRQSLDSLFNMHGYSSYGATGSVMDYFRDNILGEDKFSFDVCEPVTLTKKSSFYGEDINFNMDAWISQLVDEACKAAQRQGVDFSKYDFNNDGVVDNVFIIFAGYNQAESGNSYDIKPQLGDISSKNCVLNGKRIVSYGCYSEYTGSSGHDFAGPGTICHECCHLLDIIDFYDVNGETEGLSDALYKTTSLMDYGNFNNHGKTPPYLNAIEREMLGLLDVEEIAVGKHYDLEPIRIANKALKISTSNPKEYFLLEYRDGYKWDAHIGGKGLLIYHVDKSSEYAGYLRADIRWAINAVNCAATHPCATIFDAVGNNILGEMFLPYGSSRVLSSHTKSLLAWSGEGVGLGLKNIEITHDNRISFDVVEDFGWKIPRVTYCKAVVNQRDVELEWTQDREYEENTWTVRYGLVGDETVKVQKVVGNMCKFGGLLPGKKYVCEIAMYVDGFVGKGYTLEFQTIPEISSYPLIAEMRSRFSVGNSIALRIINLKESTRFEEWYVNGSIYEDRYLTFKSPGTYIISVRYSTDSINYFNLEKKVIVE